jgi:lipopolysaccharide transport system permease protein
MLAPPAESLVFDAADPQRLSRALRDLAEGLARWRLAWALARSDITHRYRGSVLGPLWLTMSMAVLLVALGLLYSTLFRIELRAYLPFLSVSLIVWAILSQVVSDACACLTSAEGIIRQLPLPYTVHALRCVMRNAMVAAHNLPLIAVVFAVFGVLPGWEVVLVLPGLALLAVNAFWASLLLGMLCARFRDIAPIVGSVMQLAFFLTPVIWKPELLGAGAAWMPLNPFYSVMETMRGPLLEGGASALVWVAALLYSGLACAGAFAFFVRFRGRVAFWV